MKLKVSVTNVLLLGCMAMIPVAPAYSANWVYVGSGTNGSEHYYDSETLQRSGSQVTAWVKGNYSRVAGEKIREERLRVRYDCLARTQTLISLVLYYPNGKTETAEYSVYEQRSQSIAPETIGEFRLKGVCGLN